MVSKQTSCALGALLVICLSIPALGMNGDVTWGEAGGVTACGREYTNFDLIAGISPRYFTSPNPNVDPMCGRRIKIVDPATSKYVEVQVQDKCESCSLNDINVTPVGFHQLRDLKVGRFPVQWDFVDQGPVPVPEEPVPTPAEKPTQKPVGELPSF